MTIRQPTADEVSAVCKATGEGRMQSHQWIKQHYCREHAENAVSLAELKEVILTLIPYNAGIKEILDGQAN